MKFVTVRSDFRNQNGRRIVFLRLVSLYFILVFIFKTIISTFQIMFGCKKTQQKNQKKPKNKQKKQTHTHIEESQ